MSEQDDGRTQLVSDICAEYEARRPLFVDYAGALEHLVRALLTAAGLEVSLVTGRAKEPDSLRRKVETHTSYNTLDRVTDQIGLRVVCFHKSDVERVVTLIKGEFEILEEETHGGYASPETFGYESVHLMVHLNYDRQVLKEWSAFPGPMPVEIQVRTVLQDAWAVISHKLDYKSDTDVPAESRRTLFRVAALLETSDGLFDQFRDEVEEARNLYRSEAEGAGIAELAINLESLLEAWPQLDTDSLADAAIEAGFYPPAELDPSALLLRARLGRLAAVATTVGLENIGEIQDMINGVDHYLPFLESMADRAAVAGYRPRAVPADVLTFILAAGNPLAVRPIEDAGLRTEIVDALRESDPVYLP